jgi:predicted dehydrogenase
VSNVGFGVGIVGCGLIGQKRARALGSARLVACADLIPERAQALARTEPGAFATADWRNILDRADVSIVIVATTNDTLAEVGRAAVQAGKHVLIEKPAARTARELEPVMEAAQHAHVQVRVGFNHRYHPALRKARELS